jgi:hypothetical protein
MDYVAESDATIIWDGESHPPADGGYNASGETTLNSIGRNGTALSKILKYEHAANAADDFTTSATNVFQLVYVSWANLSPLLGSCMEHCDKFAQHPKPTVLASIHVNY